MESDTKNSDGQKNLLMKGLSIITLASSGILIANGICKIITGEFAEGVQDVCIGGAAGIIAKNEYVLQYKK